MSKGAVLKARLQTLANDEIGYDDYKTQLRRYQQLLYDLIEWVEEVEKENTNGSK